MSMFSVAVRTYNFHFQQKRKLFSTSLLALKARTSEENKKVYDLNQDPEYLKFRNESSINLINELENDITAFEERHEDRKEVNKKLKEVLQNWDWNVVQSPILAPCDFIHISKAATNGTNIDILIDYRIPENESVREMQVVVSNPQKGLFYLLGSFDQKYGFKSSSSYILSKDSDIIGTRNGIVRGSAKCFESMGSLYSKVMETDELRLKEVTWLLHDATNDNTMDSLLGIREKVDIIINEYIAETTGLASLLLKRESAEFAKLRSTIWLLVRYSELEAKYKWLKLFKDFLN